MIYYFEIININIMTFFIIFNQAKYSLLIRNCNEPKIGLICAVENNDVIKIRQKRCQNIICSE